MRAGCGPAHQRPVLTPGVGPVGALALALLLGCGPTDRAELGERCDADRDCASAFCAGGGSAQASASGGDDGLRCRDPEGDPDGDGLSNFAERLAGSDPGEVDSDGDGIADGVEWGSDPSRPADRDGDGKGDLIEANDADSDGDCLADVDDANDGAIASPAELAAVACAEGVCHGNTPSARCVDGGVVTCEAKAGVGFEPAGEVSCDLLDNDCDGETDEELDGKAAAACGVSGVCKGAPSTRCVAGQWLCNLALVPQWESVEKTCDGLDNDCDGATDEAPICDDGLACTVDTCDAAKGCIHDADAAACQDGNPCTTDICDKRDGCAQIARVGVCDDDNPCTSGESCQAGKCTGGSATPCEDGSTCTANPCDSQKGCLTLPVAQGSACKPQDACQLVGSCVGGNCQPTTPLDCDDDNPCTLDSCDNLDGSCGHGAITGVCDDGNACTEGDVCVGKLCLGTAKPTCCEADAQCKDDNVCTGDSCVGGACVNSLTALDGAPCDDNNACTTASACAGGFCIATAVLNCDDGEACTIDLCKAKGGCSHAPLGDGAGCDDGDSCDGIAVCKAGACQPGIAPDCDDKNPCTDDGCTAKAGCTHSNNAIACDDGNPCTRLDACAAGSCAGSTIVCDDDRPCTADACDLSQGCVYLALAAAGAGVVACDDGDACTDKDACAEGDCAGVTLDCDDGNPCTIDTCAPAAGCSHDAQATAGKACDDGDACTVGDRCVAGACTPEVTIACPDANPCTDDACDAKTGRCVHNQGSGACVLPTGCAADAVCKAGLCVGNAIKSCCAQSTKCHDGNPCTLDICDKAQGTCSHQAVSGVACSDGDACTKGEGCLSGLCRGGAAVPCDDGNVCTADACLPNAGCVAYALDGEACADGDLCNGDERCKGESCVAGTALACDDGNGCTVDSCTAAAGCVHAGDDGASCDDGSGCTVGDACDGSGACVGAKSGAPGCCASAADCDDGFACTLDACDAVTGQCSHTARVCAAPAACDVRACSDGACTSAKRCDNPAVLTIATLSGALPGGLSSTTQPGTTMQPWAPTASGGGLIAGSPRALHAGLGAGVATLALPPLHLPAGGYRLALTAKLDVPAGCATGALRATLDGAPLGPALCGPSTTTVAVDLPFAVTAATDVHLALRFEGSAAADPSRGGFVDGVVVRALPDPACPCGEGP